MRDALHWYADHLSTIALCTFALGVLITITDARRYRAQANRRTTRQEHDV
jgi:hypothetical protein